MCWCRACAGPWKCVLECASWARTCVCSRARVHVCCAGAAGRAYSRRKRFARSRAAELPDLAASARPTAMPCTVHGNRKFFTALSCMISSVVLVATAVPRSLAVHCSGRHTRVDLCRDLRLAHETGHTRFTRPPAITRLHECHRFIARPSHSMHCMCIVHAALQLYCRHATMSVSPRSRTDVSHHDMRCSLYRAG